jgi:hypothetical protein
MSVYFPPTKQDEQLEIYRKLAFPQRTGWDRLIEWVFEEFA